MLLTSFFVVVTYRHNVIGNSAIATIVARRRQAAGPKFLMVCSWSTFQWFLYKHMHWGMQQKVAAKIIQPTVAVRCSGHV